MATKTVTEPVDHDAVRDFVMTEVERLIAIHGNQWIIGKLNDAGMKKQRKRLQSAVEWAMARARIAELKEWACSGCGQTIGHNTGKGKRLCGCVISTIQCPRCLHLHAAEADAAEKWSKLV